MINSINKKNGLRKVMIIVLSLGFFQDVWIYRMKRTKIRQEIQQRI